MFTTDRLILRGPTSADADAVLKLDDDTQTQTNLTLRPVKPLSQSHVTNFLAQSDSAFFFAIVTLKPTLGDPEQGKFLGYAALFYPGGGGGETGLSAATVKNRDVSLGLAIVDDERGKGYGTEIIDFLVRWAFEMGGVHRVSLEAYEFNQAAIKVYERCGFKHEGRKRSANFVKGRWWDIISMGILEDEWRASHPDQSSAP